MGQATGVFAPLDPGHTNPSMPGSYHSTDPKRWFHNQQAPKVRRSNPSAESSALDQIAGYETAS